MVLQVKKRLKMQQKDRINIFLKCRRHYVKPRKDQAQFHSLHPHQPHSRPATGGFVNNSVIHVVSSLITTAVRSDVTQSEHVTQQQCF